MRSNIKALASVHCQAQCHAATWQRGCRGFQHPAGIEPKSPDSLQLTLTCQSDKKVVKNQWLCQSVRVSLTKKFVYDSSYYLKCFATCNCFFCVQTCQSRIAQVQGQPGQARKTRILERKPLINTSYRIRHRLELKYFHLKLAQFLLIAHRAAHQPWKSDNWELEILDWSSRSSYEWLVSNTVDDCLQAQIAKKKASNRKLKLVLSMLVTTWLLNVAFHSSLLLIWCKLWLWSIQNHTRHRFQTFARRYLKLLCLVCCSIRIWADTLCLDRSST